ncbi:MAG TPA: MFS transporter [Aquifex aeolicus]|nr:MFS transporter [Aquifex aeolicus]
MREKIRLFSFSLFDTGETILGALVVSTFFPLYITKHIDVKLYSLLYSFSFFISFIFSLILGKIADEKALRKHFFGIFSFLTSLSTLFLFLFYEFPFIALLSFLLLLIFHQQAMVFYNSLLIGFEQKGFTSGIGVAFGYIGSAFALIFLANSLKEPQIYVYVTIIFTLLFIPAILFLENPEKKALISLKEIVKDKSFLLFLISLLSITEVANTLIAMMGVYLREVYDLENIEIYKIIGLSAIGGVLGGILWGFLTDKLGVNRIFPLGFFLWSIFILLLYVTPKNLLIPLGFFAGLSLSHLWTTGRVFLIKNFPQNTVSVRMSFLSLSERVASSVGLGLWSLLLFITNNNFKLSALLLIALPLSGAIIYFLTFFKWK